MRVEQASSNAPGPRRGHRFRPVEIARPSRGIDQGDRGGGKFRRDINYASGELRNRPWRIFGYPAQRDAREPQFASSRNQNRKVEEILADVYPGDRSVAPDAEPA
jgi:hypothetical protein